MGFRLNIDERLKYRFGEIISCPTLNLYNALYTGALTATAQLANRPRQITDTSLTCYPTDSDFTSCCIAGRSPVPPLSLVVFSLGRLPLVRLKVLTYTW